jgi:LacI family transcriptional regulator
MMNLTLEKIGELAGVSRSTVSRVINNHPNVSDDVRERVARIIKETGFSPNLAARTLASQRSFVIGLVIPRSIQSLFGDPYFSRLTQGIVQAANLFDYTISLFLLESREIEERIIPRITRPGFIDGLVVQSTAYDDKVLSRIVNSTIPYVIAGRPLEFSDVSYIDVDNFNGAFQAVEHLIGLGKKRIGTVTGPLNAAPGIERRQGYIKALEENSLPLDESIIVESDFTEEGGYRATNKILSTDLDALFVASDQMGLGALQAIREAGLRVPEDIALVGFDDLPPALYANPQLTTIRQPILRFGIAAVEILTNLIEEKAEPPQSLIMDVELIIRDSCGVKVREQ